MEKSSLKVPVLLMARYNIWANQQHADFFLQASEARFGQFVENGFPSIRATFLHIWDAQDIWYRRLHGESPKHFLSQDWNGSPAELFAGLISSSLQLEAFAEELSVEILEEEFQYSTLAKGPQVSRRYEVLLHVFNHSMYHRGQCVTMARTIGLEGIPSTDLILYLRTG